MSAEEVRKERASLQTSFRNIETSFANFKAASKTMFTAQDDCVKSIGAQKKAIGELLDMAKRKPAGLTDQERTELERETAEQKSQLSRMEVSFPQKKSVLLGLVLGDVNMTLPKMGDRFKYKEDYEKFKARMTMITVLISLLNLTLLPFRFVEALLHCLIVWFYCTATLREHILIANGSRIRNWYLWHHYISVVLTAMLLIWPDGFAYQAFRTQFHIFTIYVGVLQFIQFRYQTSRLYMLRALGKTDAMEVTAEMSSRGLTYLVVMLMIGHGFQVYNAYTLYEITMDPRCLEWHPSALAVIFIVLASGNFITLMRTLVHKAKKHPASA
ncbi:transmembrane protein [Capsaspora owczarzaki ATCC 30864]|uniref:Transmembrane protein n=1 Tax=Capsaspora owczarzaki (strain ATCC 30864) TaxID=595528 RepID=A0A0D2WK05_CAPO3|nr:transmembrane protein [Capsaspora owczarzaki ATCC 30864]KJE90490.1 transmembrane protein [Capsaspora owczarzaki ATCC 30864]|eukprot:XP_004364668.1 transmembrane protein [Capsaspora owczarzaki ATCC 30864]